MAAGRNGKTGRISRIKIRVRPAGAVEDNLVWLAEMRAA
jgi:hypothetical protein